MNHKKIKQQFHKVFLANTNIKYHSLFCYSFILFLNKKPFQTRLMTGLQKKKRRTRMTLSHIKKRRKKLSEGQKRFFGDSCWESPKVVFVLAVYFTSLIKHLQLPVIFFEHIVFLFFYLNFFRVLVRFLFLFLFFHKGSGVPFFVVFRTLYMTLNRIWTYFRLPPKNTFLFKCDNGLFFVSHHIFRALAREIGVHKKRLARGFFWGGESNKSGCLGFFGGGHSWQMWKPKVRKSFFPAFLEMRKRVSLCLEGTKISHLAYLASRLNVFSRSNIYIFGHTPRLPFKKPSNSNLVSHLPPRLVRIFMRRRWPRPHSYQICVKYFFLWMYV